MRTALISLLLLLPSMTMAEARMTTPPYAPPKVVYDFYLDHPAKTGAALYWIRALINPLTVEPYVFAPEMMSVKVVLHGTELVTVVRRNYDKYRDVVERMRYYASLGVEFKVCAMAAEEYHYAAADFHDFIEIVPSAFTELVHWQMQGYALITPQVPERNHTIDDVR